jgi:hypothetical protein
MKLGYLISQYPALRHTFVLREVLFGTLSIPAGRTARHSGFFPELLSMSCG